MTTTLTDQSGRAWAYLGAVLGGAVSIAANVAHSFIPPTDAPVGWSPEIGAVVGAIVWPVFLFIAVEILARVKWPAGFWWGAMRFGGLLPVASVAAFVSYKHLSGLLAHYGEQTIVSTIGPLAVDGLMVMATGAILATSARAHALTTIQPVPAPLVSPVLPTSTPPVAERPAPVRVSPALSAVAPDGEPAAPPATPAQVSVPTAPTLPPAPPTRDILVATVDTARPITAPVPAAMLTRAVHLAEAHRTATGQPITAGELAVRMRVNSATAAQLLAVIDLQPNSPTAPLTTVNGTPVGAHK